MNIVLQTLAKEIETPDIWINFNKVLFSKQEHIILSEGISSSKRDKMAKTNANVRCVSKEMED